MSATLRSVYRLKEQETGTYSFTVNDENGAPIPASAMNSVTLTLYVVHTGAVVNGRNAQSVLNANQVTISEAGAVAWALQVADTAIADSTRKMEVHRALFVFTWNTSRKKTYEVDFEIENLGKLT